MQTIACKNAEVAFEGLEFADGEKDSTELFNGRADKIILLLKDKKSNPGGQQNK